ncbi:MAG: carbon-nitrogen family hydrolase [Nitrospirae bacterium]|nr:carbon-nitrogen family hydrolase [Nitrospirota bacterium]
MKIALIQLNIEWESKTSNNNSAGLFIEKAAYEGCDTVVFPEMFNTGFSMNMSSIAEDANGETSSILSKLAKQYNVNVIAGFPVKSHYDNKAENIAVVYDRSGALIARYSKLHPFSFAGEEQYYFAGNSAVTFNIEGMPSSIFICYDLRFPEVFRIVAREVQAVFVIANWPASRKDHWETLLKARAIENQCYVVGVNRTGTDGNGIRYPGDSHIFGPSGEKICSGGEEEFLTGEIDPGQVMKTRLRFPFLSDMRPVNPVVLS